jgi:AcrR family transcriptional regulator
MNRVMPGSSAPTVDLRTVHRDDTRRVILEAFLELLDDESPLTISMPEVAARSGVSVRTLYRYFPNKDALMESANEWFSARAQQMIGNRMVDLDALGVYLENVWTAFSENIAAVRVQHTSAGGREFRARRTAATRQTIDAALPDVIPDDRRGDVVDVIGALASSSMFLELVERFGHSPARAAALSTHLIHLFVDSEVDAAESSSP